MSLGIRAATVLDAEALARVHATSWRESFTGLLDEELIAGKEQRMLEIYPEALADGATTHWIATWEGETVGFAAARALGPGDVRPLELTSLYILAAVQRRGIGARLLNYAIGTAPCLLWVLDGSAAESFYRTHGFERDGVSEQSERLGGALIHRMVR